LSQAQKVVLDALFSTVWCCCSWYLRRYETKVEYGRVLITLGFHPLSPVSSPTRTRCAFLASAGACSPPKQIVVVQRDRSCLLPRFSAQPRKPNLLGCLAYHTLRRSKTMHRVTQSTHLSAAGPTLYRRVFPFFVLRR
jgi:hypothetical protein